MQYKLIVPALLVALAAAPSYAQYKVTSTTTVVIKKPQPEAPKQDSVITYTGKQATKPGASVLAYNEKYSRVPLAGEKAYFGDKNEFVNDYVRKYLEAHNRTLGSVQDKSATPFSVIDKVLEKKNLPKELKYLAVIESALNHNAVSHAGAVGPWQLMASTARMMGLTVTRKGDERRDLQKSTAAATKYLEVLYSQLNDWLLVIAAYNSGPVPVQRAIEKTGSHNFWDIKKYLPRETQGHVLAFIATASIFENLSKFISLGSVPVDFKFGKEEDPPLPLMRQPAASAATAGTPANTTATGAKPTPVAGTVAGTPPAGGMAVKQPAFTEDELKNMAIVRITEPVHFEVVNAETGIDKKLLAKWNPDYDLFIYNTYPTPYYRLRIPKDKLDVFLGKKEVITKKSAYVIAQAK